MKLYLDLQKALPQVPAVGADHKSGERAAKQHKESFSRDHVGVSGGSPTADKPEVGRKWSHPDEEESEADKNKILKDSDTVKAQEAVDLLKSLTSDMYSRVAQSMPNVREIEYLTQECGYKLEDVVKGHAKIAGYERARFSRWLHKRLQDSVNRLLDD